MKGTGNPEKGGVAPSNPVARAAREDFPGSRTIQGTLLEPLVRLSRDIGPRPAGSHQERKSARYLERELRAMGLRPEPDSFLSPTNPYYGKAIVLLAPVLGVLLYPWKAPVSFLAVTLGYIFLLADAMGRNPFVRWQAHRLSANVSATIPSRGKAEETLVLVAHIDSPLAFFPDNPFLEGVTRALLRLCFPAITILFLVQILLFGGYLLRVKRETLMLIWELSLILLPAPASTGLVYLDRAAQRRATPGGNDNASGVAVVMQLARILSRRPFLHTDIWILFSGASQPGAMGLRRFLRVNRKELRKARILVVDEVGRGSPASFRKEGRVWPFKADRVLLSLAEGVSKTHVRFLPPRRRNPCAGEALQALNRGVKALTVSCVEEGGRTKNHLKTGDDHLNVDLRSLRLAVAFIKSMMEGLDRMATEKAARRAEKDKKRTRSSTGPKRQPRRSRPSPRI